ncbi:MAG: PHB depolymerase family esterase [Pseudomonadota bacterium]
MVRASSPLLRGLMRVSKAQQRTASKLVDSLFGAPLKPRAKTGAKPRAAVKPMAKVSAKPQPASARPVAAASAAAVSPAKAPARRAAPRAALAPLPGKWLAAHYSKPLLDLGLPGHGLNYWLYLPDKAPSEAVRRGGWPLLVMLHGCEQSATQFAQGTRMNRLAEQKGFAVLYPQQSIGSHSHRCWKWYDKATQAGGGDVELIVGMIGKVAAAYPIDRSRIYIGGISAGAGMANIVALNHPHLIAAVGLHSAPVFGAGHSAIGALGVMQRGASHRADGAIAEVLAASPAFPRMPTILIQGEGDRVVRPINQTHLMRQSLLLNRMPIETAISVELKPGAREGSRNPANPHQIRDFHVNKKLLLRVAQIAHLEHAWSGGDAALSFNAKAGPDASKMMVDFFLRHRRT